MDTDTEEAIKRRILALMAKTTENGCTEEEAISAAEKVQQMLHEHQLELSDLKIKESACTQAEYNVQQKSDPMVMFCIMSIGYFTDCEVWRDTDWKTGWRLYKYFGLEHDVMVAEYITKVCDWAIIWGGEDFKKTEQWAGAAKNKKGRLKADYQYGMARRLAERLREMKDKQVFNDRGTGRNLVVLKSAVVQAEFSKLDLKLTSRQSMGRRVNPEAYDAGQAAGDKVPLNPGVREDDSAQSIT